MVLIPSDEAEYVLQVEVLRFVDNAGVVVLSVGDMIDMCYMRVGIDGDIRMSIADSSHIEVSSWVDGRQTADC